jgi:hypothetical protein
LFLAGLFSGVSETAKFFAWYLGVRSLVTPGAFIVFYADYFGEHGYTYWTNISGINLLFEAPSIYADHNRWPSLGHMIGEDYIGKKNLNANANFIASDGVAGFGILGVIMVLVLFGYFIKALDRLSRGIPNSYLLTALVPLSLTLTNASLFTTLSSFGGFVILLALRYGHKETVVCS